ncbi:unnamed protein product [Toxocara canis]|uniref:Protein kinase domain-containing protein n=1 Tax=Toxocara canis TaxID=6265 RepID=A0A3P7H2E3_TOXCA|nr:unnamed protein product [Toxocara canis]
MRFCIEGAAGLAYLESVKCIHRDIAARNVLLSETHQVKVSDFGMSDERTMMQDEKLDKVPIKWLAPETMQQRIYSLKTDVWSYGIMRYDSIQVWEIYAEGYEPYPSLSNIQTRAKIIVQNYRMEMPKGTPAAVSQLIAQCWAKNPAERPAFTTIHQTLQDIAAKESTTT